MNKNYFAIRVKKKVFDLKKRNHFLYSMDMYVTLARKYQPKYRKNIP